MIERVGIVGGGQLGRMLTEAAKPLGFDVMVVDPNENCPAAQVGAEHIQEPLASEDALLALAWKNDVVTWEIEHIPADYLVELAENGANIEPSPATLKTIQDKLRQKELLQNAGIPVAPFTEGPDTTLPGPYVVKSRKGGYDGRGNLVVDELGDTQIADFFGATPTYVEQTVDFQKELSAIVARDTQGRTAVYPIVETIHKDNICHVVMSPADIAPDTTSQAVEVAHETLKQIGGAGVFAIEMFLANDEVLVNEIAPRVHNSGHHTIEANVTSQFEQHIRAITGMPLGATAMRASAAVMINILGQREEPLTREGLDKALELFDVHPHFYGKSSRPARKIGHITVLGDSIDEVSTIAHQARKELKV